MLNKIILVFSIAVLVSTKSIGQFHNEKFLRAKLLLAYENQPERDFSTIDSKYKSAKYAMGFKLPLLNRVGKGGDQGAFKLTGLMFNLNASRNDLEMTFLNENHKLFHAGAGFDFIYFPGRKILYLVNFNANIFQDNYISGTPDFRYTGFFLMNYKANKIVSLKAGLSYSFLFGRGAPLPVIGAGFNFKSGTDITILLPYYFSVAQKLNSQSKLTVSLKPDGSVYDFANKGNFVGYPPVIQLRQRAYKLALNYAFDANENVKFFLEGGLIGNTTISFSEAKVTDKQTFYDQDVANGLFVKAGFVYSFGQAPRYGKQHGVNFMLDYDVNATEMKE